MIAKKPVTVLIVGAGSRGTGYAEFIRKHPDLGRVVGVAEPREFYRQRLVDQHGITPAHVFTDWKPAADVTRLADAVIIATPDALHADPAVAFARKGYQVLLEKPMAPSEADCRRIVQAVTDAGVILAVCHVMRYTAYTQQLKAMLNAGAVGEIVNIQHLEPVGWWHQAHSFVRGNWRNQAESSCMLLAKSCHDLDWLHYMMGCKCRKVSSFGSLFHFRRDQQPAGAADRCLDCSVESQCAYSARRIYMGFLAKGSKGWPLDVLTPSPSEETITEALRSGPYGRCVYRCDNDVVDHQVVNMEFEGGRSASFTMTAFNRGGHRKTRIHGTKGEIYGDGRMIEHFDFLTGASKSVDTAASDGTVAGGHGGGDDGIMHSFLGAVAANDPSKVLSGAQETFESHQMVFRAEEARLQRCVLDV